MRKEFDKVLQELKLLLSQFNIDTDHWMIVGPFAYEMLGFKVEIARPLHFHVMMPVKNVPWKLAAQEKKRREVSPRPNSKFWPKYNDFIEKTNYDYDILIATKEKWKTYLEEKSTQVKLSDGAHVRVIKPEFNIEIEKNIFSQFNPFRFDKLKQYYESLLEIVSNDKTSDIYKKNRAFLKKITLLAKHHYFDVDREKEYFKNTSALQGDSVYPGRIRGKAVVLSDIEHLSKPQRGKIVVTISACPKCIESITQSIGLITDEGGALTHAAILSRELEIPCIVGTKVATKVLKNGDWLELDADNGIVRKLN